MMVYEPARQELYEWFDGQFGEELAHKYGNDANIDVIILKQGVQHDWQHPEHTVEVQLFTDHAKSEGPEGLRQNVFHKLHFVLRTGLDSSEARLHPELIFTGDFPFEGAGTYRGFIGGVSGLKEESDWWVFRRVIDKYIELREVIARRAMQASNARVPGMKYMEGDWATA